MKKKNLKSLKLNKQTISGFRVTEIKGGTITLTFVCITCDIIISIATDTKPDCVNTWGDDSCPTGINGICVADFG